MADDKDTGNILTRGAGALKDYWDKADFTPGYLGAALGAGAGALMTERKVNEMPAARAKRILRNALLSGVLGGVGTQAALGGLSGMSEAIGQEEKRKDYQPGVGSSTLARTAYTGGVNSILRFVKNRRADLMATGVFGKRDKPGTMRPEGTTTHPNGTTSPWRYTEHVNTIHDPKAGGKLSNPDRVFRKSLMQELRSIFDRTEARGDKLEIHGVGQPQIAEAARKHLTKAQLGADDFLKYMQLTGAAKGHKAWNVIDAILANPSAHNPNKYWRRGGRVGSAAVQALAFAAPSLIGKPVSEAFNSGVDSAVSGVVGGGLPDAGAHAEKAPENIFQKLVKGY